MQQSRSAIKTIALVLILTIAAAHRLPAPIIEESPTPKPKPVHQTAPASPSSNTSAAASKTRETEKHRGNATVFIYRPAGFPWLMYNNMVVTIDGVQARTMADARYSMRNLSPGKHVFEAKGGFVTSQRVPVELNLQGEEKYYLRVSIDAMGFPEGKIIFKQVPSSEGAADIAKLKPGP